MRMSFSAPLLTLCGLCVFTAFGYAFFIHETKPTVDPLAGKSTFEKGEYFFNHDADPGGAYDMLKAKAYYQQALREDDTNPLAWYQLGRVYFIEGNFDDALSSFETLNTRFPNVVPNVDYMIGLTYGYKARTTNNQEDWKKAEDAFLRFIEKAPTSPYPRVDLAWVYFSQGKFTEMKAPLEAGLTYAPHNPWLLNMYGLALLNTGEQKKALNQFNEAHEQALLLTVEDWGRTYPGNDPALWEKGLEEFRTLIEKNIALGEAQ